MKKEHPDWDERNNFPFLFVTDELELLIREKDICDGWTIMTTAPMQGNQLCYASRAMQLTACIIN